jgi:superfamily II DNA helicase RecQ
VVQWHAPPSLSVWVQHAGRAGRDGQQARSVLMVEPAIFQERRRPPEQRGKDASSNASRDDEHNESNEQGLEPIQRDDGFVVYRKKCDPDLRSFVMTPECRRKFLVDYYRNPEPSNGEAPNSDDSALTYFEQLLRSTAATFVLVDLFLLITKLY